MGHHTRRKFHCRLNRNRRNIERMASSTELCFRSAREITGLVREREASASEVLEMHLEQIERVNPRVNAIPTLVPDHAREQAHRIDEDLAQGRAVGPLAGLPIAIKDLVDTAGIRTTYGSPIYRDFVPGEDALFVKRVREAGAIVIGKTNTPEFGAGSHTFNEVFGLTRNPYDLSRSCGGSSGGAAVALACGMVPIADGSDLGGSMRNPPNFNNVVGLRPSPGRIPRYPANQPWNRLSVLGAMGRKVCDVALLLSVMAGPDNRDPISIIENPTRFRDPLDRDLRGMKIAWSPDLGMFPVEPQVIEAIERVLPVFGDLGCEVEENHPDFSGAAEVFQILRAELFASSHEHELQDHRNLMKDTVVWNIEEGLKLSAMDVARAQERRAELFHRVRHFLEIYDYLLLPVSQVAPFSVEIKWIREINGIPMKSYIDWMQSCSLISLTEHPAMSVPCGFTSRGLPVGLQMVGRHRGELELLQLAHAFEQATGVGERRPHLALT